MVAESVASIRGNHSSTIIERCVSCAPFKSNSLPSWSYISSIRLCFEICSRKMALSLTPPFTLEDRFIKITSGGS